MIKLIVAPAPRRPHLVFSFDPHTRVIIRSHGKLDSTGYPYRKKFNIL